VTSNLPAELTSFIGRNEELAEVKRLLSNARLLTLTGPGGVGKTRLAIEVARAAGGRHHDGIWLVELGPLQDQALVPHQLAEALKIHEEPNEPIAETLIRALLHRDVLLVLDNCEHVIAACAHLTEHLLKSCPSLTIVATSREQLGIPGEVVFLVPPLPQPEAAALFVERALRARPETALGTHEHAVSQLCRQLDGLPLAIELAAACVRFLSIEDVCTRLDQRFGLLVGASRTAPLRHQTLRATVEWSHDLLSPTEQQLFRRLSVFAGGCTLEAIEAVCEGDGVLWDLRRLVEKSLVVAEEQDGLTRYRMLETLRQYAAENLREGSEERQLRNRHLEWCGELAECGELALRDADQDRWLRLLRRELDNFRAALTWASLEPTQREAGLRLISALANFWWWIGYATEASDWLQRLSLQAQPGVILAKALTEAAFLHLRQGDPAAAQPFAEEAVRLSRQLDLRSNLATALMWLSQALCEQGNARQAKAVAAEAVGLARKLDGWPRVYRALFVLGRIHQVLGELDKSRACQEEALALAYQRGDNFTASVINRHLASVLIDCGELAAARQYLERSLHAGRSIATSRLAPALAQLAGVAAAEGDMPRALRLGGAAVGLRQAVSARLQPSDVIQMERRLEGARAALGADAAQLVWSEGAAMSVEEAVAYALGNALAAPGLLTGRERQVVALLAQGMSNRDVASRLVITEGTTKRHVENILAKLGLRSRAQVADWFSAQSELGAEQQVTNVSS